MPLNYELAETVRRALDNQFGGSGAVMARTLPSYPAVFARHAANKSVPAQGIDAPKAELTA